MEPKMFKTIELRISSLATKERKKFYSALFILVSVVAHLSSILLGNGNADYFNSPIGQDFIGFYSAARLFLLDRAHQIYDIPTLSAMQQEIVPGLQSTTPYMNPPFALLIYAPFGMLPYKTAWLLWVAMQLAFFVIAIRLLYSALQIDNPIKTSHPNWLYIASFPPVVLWITYGQATGLIFLILSASIVLLLRGRDFLAGIVLGMLAFKPHLALGVAIPLILALRIRAILGGASSVGLFLGLSFAFFPQETLSYPKAISYFYTFFNGNVNGLYFPLWGEVTIASSIGVLTYPFPLWVGTILQWASYCLGGWLMVRLWKPISWQPDSSSWKYAMAGSVFLSLLFNAHLYQYDLVLLIPVFILLEGTKLKNSIALQAWVPVIYVLSLFSPHLSRIQLRLSVEIIGTPLFLQLITIVLLFAFFRVRQEGLIKSL